MPNDKPRFTRRGRLILLAAAVVVVAGGVLTAILLGSGDSGGTRSLLIPEGWRASQVYAAADKALDVPPGTTQKAAATADLKLPPEAKGNPEGYLFPATYPIDGQTSPAGLLTYMVNTANQHFGADHIAAGAKRNGVTVYQTVVIASIVQAEADTTADMGKVSRVIYNRLAQGMPLQMDSTLNYALNRSTLDTTTGDTKIDSPYNTYERKGLPPTPIGNPGQDAMNAAIAPTPGNWLYFVTVAPGDTRFTDDYSEQQKNVREFNDNQKSARG
ncbi:endolytic transglycosylase MltG [Streptomyces sp. NPDC050738]|uniref:endolytic transglycosylase MltG n=1 Tax=Streptomyces sp. NPDC050738 TaxID=3154744 RepID=UPI003426EF9A